MKARTGLTALLTPFGYALALIISSANAFQKYLGTSSLYLYIVAVLIAVSLANKIAGGAIDVQNNTLVEEH